jgi:hypothetical protein
MSMGVNGGFVVHPRSGSNPKYNAEFTLLINDYNHDWDSTMDFLKMQVSSMLLSIQFNSI